MTAKRLSVDWTLCTGHLVCADILPELVTVDDWGYPDVSDGAVPDRLLRHVRRARATCPALALRLLDAPVRAARSHRERPEAGIRVRSAPGSGAVPPAPTVAVPDAASRRVTAQSASAQSASVQSSSAQRATVPVRRTAHRLAADQQHGEPPAVPRPRAVARWAGTSGDEILARPPRRGR